VARQQDCGIRRRQAGGEKIGGRRMWRASRSERSGGTRSGLSRRPASPPGPPARTGGKPRRKCGSPRAVLRYAGTPLRTPGTRPRRPEASAPGSARWNPSAAMQGAGRQADVRAVEIEPDALLELLDHLLGQAGIGACGAGLRAGVAFVDTADQSLADVAPHVRVRTDDVSRVHGTSRRETELGRSGRNLGSDRNGSSAFAFPRQPRKAGGRCPCTRGSVSSGSPLPDFDRPAAAEQHSESDEQSGRVHDRQAGDEAKQRGEGQARVARPLRHAIQVSRDLDHHLEDRAGADPKAQRSPMW
jgi:hypothetical protein